MIVAIISDFLFYILSNILNNDGFTFYILSSLKLDKSSIKIKLFLYYEISNNYYNSLLFASKWFIDIKIGLYSKYLSLII